MDQRLNKAIEHHQAGRLNDAESLYREVLRDEPQSLLAIHNLGVLDLQRGRAEEALTWLDRAIALAPSYRPALLNAGHARFALGRAAEAAVCFERAVALDSNDAAAWFNLGMASAAAKSPEEAIRAFRRAIEGNPGLAEAHRQLGTILLAQGETGEALASFRRAVAAAPDDVAALNSLALLLADLGGAGEAIVLLRRAVALAPGVPELYCNLGVLERGQGDVRSALATLRKAVALAPDSARILNNLGLVLAAAGKTGEAIDAYRQSLLHQPGSAETLANLGFALREEGRSREALDAFDQASAIDPDLAVNQRFLLRLDLCEWDGIGEAEHRLVDAVRRSVRDISPFATLVADATPAEQLACARRWSARWDRVTPLRHPGRDGAKIRLGYLSGDFGDHPVMALAVETFERHDRGRFEVSAYSYAPPGDTPMRRRLEAAFDRFADIRDLSFADAARRIHDDGIDILVDLSGYTRLARPHIPALRPAPVQVSFLGFPGTMGADFIDYLVADDYLVPQDARPFYTEKVVSLPDCYQPGDSQRRAVATNRAVCGLPGDALVFVAFNSAYKITPRMFDIWMRLLRASPKAVLWLFTPEPAARDNLRREAISRGVAATRLVFADRVAYADYLGRLALGDLFLDCFPYNAGATASDALWAGLPLVTCSGATYVSRMAGSLLRAASLPELIARSLDEYEELALSLIREPERLAGLRRRLVEARDSSPLFDTARFTRNLESAFVRMWEIHESGRLPESFSV